MEGKERTLIRTPDLKLNSVTFLDGNDKEISSVVNGQYIQLSVGFLFLKTFEDPHVGFIIRDRTGYLIFITVTSWMNYHIGKVRKGTSLEIRFGFYFPFTEGDYTVSVVAAEGKLNDISFRQVTHYLPDAIVLKVLKKKEDHLWQGLINLDPKVSVRILDSI